MMEENKQRLSLHRAATYRIEVPGHLDEGWTEWDGKLAVATTTDVDGTPVTVLTGTIDQAALQGLLRRLYALGLPLISVNLIRSPAAASTNRPATRADNIHEEN